MEAVEGTQGLLMPKLTVKQRQEKLFEELNLSGFESWLPELADSVQSVLAEYHDVFSLESSKLGCTHSTEHVIKVTDNTPFKEWFRWIPHHWWKKFACTCKKCWIQAQFTPARVHAVMQWCWFERRMRSLFLYRLPLPQCPHEGRLLCTA